MEKTFDPLKVVERQDAIIRIQSTVIDELFLLLMQHISAEEADRLPVLDKISTAAKIRQDLVDGAQGGKGPP